MLKKTQAAKATNPSRFENMDINEWLKSAVRIHRWAIEKRNEEALHLAQFFLSDCLQISNLLNAFHLSPRRAIYGPKGVAMHYDVSKTTVNNRIKSLGLTPNHFRDPHASIEQLVLNSVAIRPILEGMWEYYAEAHNESSTQEP